MTCASFFIRGNSIAFHTNQGAHICYPTQTGRGKQLRFSPNILFISKHKRFPKKEMVHDLWVTQSINWVLNTNFKLLFLQKKVYYTQKKRFILLVIYIQIHYVCKSLLWLMDWICFWICTFILVFIHTVKHHSYIHTSRVIVIVASVIVVIVVQ